MEGINYHHLYYFYTVARLGTIAKASEQLRLTQPTISEQIRLLESSLGSKLFQKSGRNLVLTEAGKTACGYAEKIFSLGQELTDAVDGKQTPARARHKIGIATTIPSLLAFRLLRPVTSLGHVVASQDSAERLVVKLATHELDFVLADEPAARNASVKVASRKLLECGITFVGASSIAAKCNRKFPECLNGAPMLLPTANSALRRSLESWFKKRGIRPQVLGEFDDNGLMLELGRETGVCAVPSAIAKEIVRGHGLKAIGRTDDVAEKVFLISTERKLRNPAAIAIAAAAGRAE